MTTDEKAQTIRIQLAISPTLSPALHAALLAGVGRKARASRLRELALQGLAFEASVLRTMGTASASTQRPKLTPHVRDDASTARGDVPAKTAPGVLVGTLEWSSD